MGQFFLSWVSREHRIVREIVLRPRLECVVRGSFNPQNPTYRFWLPFRRPTSGSAASTWFMLSLFVGYSWYWTFKIWVVTLVFLGVKKSSCDARIPQRSERLFSNVDGVAIASVTRLSLLPVCINPDTTFESYLRYIFVSSSLLTVSTLLSSCSPNPQTVVPPHIKLAILFSNRCRKSTLCASSFSGLQNAKFPLLGRTPRQTPY
jgi:hypothetical protein